MFIEWVTIHDIAKMIYIDHLNMHGFINSKVPNIGSLMDTCNGRVIYRVVQFSPYGINTSFNISNRNSKYVVVWISFCPGYLVIWIIYKFFIVISVLSFYVHVNWDYTATWLVIVTTLYIDFFFFSSIIVGGL